MREAVGDDLQIMVDLNQWWRMAGDISPALDVAAVRPVAAELAELGVAWLEEPLPAADLAGMRMLREQTGIRVAGGEMARSVPELLGALEAGALDVVQPDVVLAVGLLRARTVAELALARNRWFTPHTWTNGLGLLANLHVVAGVGGGPYVEFPYDPPGWTPQRRDFFLAEPVGIDADGLLRVPARPGLGAEIDEVAVARWAVGGWKSSVMKVGFIGLGHMGAPMSANILAAGHDLVVHDVRAEAAAQLVASGASWASSPRAAGPAGTS